MINNNENLQQIYLGFDFGLKKIGVAVGQSITHTATPLPILQAQQGIPKWQEIANLVKKWKPIALVVGIPRQMDDTESGIVTKKAQNFAVALGKHFDIKVHIVDERLTTKAAREFIYDNFGYKALQKEPIDSFAAKIILESWMKQE